MKIITIIFFCLMLLPDAALACRALPAKEQIAADEIDLKREISMTTELVVTADQIFLATATSIEKDTRKASFELIEALIGESEQVFSAVWDGSRVTIGCRASYGFNNILLEEGQSYLLYLRDGQIRRASKNETGRSGMSFIHELLIVRGQLLSNK